MLHDSGWWSLLKKDVTLAASVPAQMNEESEFDDIELVRLP